LIDRAVLSPTTRGSMHGEMGHTKFIRTISTSLPARLSATRDTGMEWAVNWWRRHVGGALMRSVV